MGDEGAKAIGEGLRVNNSLTELDLGRKSVFGVDDR